MTVLLTSAHARQTLADGTVRELTRPAGEVVLSGPVTHATENESDDVLVVLEIELKGSVPPAPASPSG